MTEGELLTIEDVAKRLQVSQRSVRRYLADGRMKAVRMSRKIIRVRAEDLETFINEHRNGG